MNAKDHDRYRKLLSDLRDRLAGEIRTMAETVRTDARAVGEHDRAVSETVEKELALEHTEEDIRRQIAAALERLDAGTYGTCQECGGQIARSRLDVVPYTPYCIRCERLQEQQ